MYRFERTEIAELSFVANMKLMWSMLTEAGPAGTAAGVQLIHVARLRLQQPGSEIIPMRAVLSKLALEKKIILTLLHAPISVLQLMGVSPFTTSPSAHF